MNLSSPFVRRPVGTVLLTVWLALAGIAAFFRLPVASLPQVDFPVISVSANVAPRMMSDLVAAARMGNGVQARNLQVRMNALHRLAEGNEAGTERTIPPRRGGLIRRRHGESGRPELRHAASGDSG